MKDRHLKQATKRTSAQWIAYVQRRIVARSRPTDDPNHDATDVALWFGDLFRRVWRDRPKRGAYDENMYMASTVGLILVLWFVRIQRAKAYDPRRPVALRRDALKRLRDYQLTLMDVLFDESQDPDYFPGQHWDPPSSPHAVDGVFI